MKQDSEATVYIKIALLKIEPYAPARVTVTIIKHTSWKWQHQLTFDLF